MSERLSKYIASFDHFHKSLTVLSATSGIISITSFSTVIGASAGTASKKVTLAFSISTGIMKKMIKATRNKKKEQ